VQHVASCDNIPMVSTKHRALRLSGSKEGMYGLVLAKKRCERHHLGYGSKTKYMENEYYK
jgi:hypothetical protein